MSASKREEILATAARLTSANRNKDYGEPEVNLRCAAELKAIYDQYAKDSGKAHQEAIHQVLTKISRIACGVYKEDNYVDGAAYFAIAGQVGVPQTTFTKEQASNTGINASAVSCTCGATKFNSWHHRSDCPVKFSTSKVTL